MNIKTIKQGEKDYNELKLIVSLFNETEGTLEELCKELKGHNLEDDLFDVNFKSITATVKQNYGCFKVDGNIEIWDTNGNINVDMEN